MELWIEGRVDENAPIVGRSPDGNLLYGYVSRDERPDADELPEGVLVEGVREDGPRVWRADGPWLTDDGRVVVAAAALRLMEASGARGSA